MVSHEKRLKRVLVTPEFIVELLRRGAKVSGGRIVRRDGRIVRLNTTLPAEMRLHHAYYDAEQCAFVLVLEHESFEPVTEGGVIPIEPVTEETL